MSYSAYLHQVDEVAAELRLPRDVVDVLRRQEWAAWPSHRTLRLYAQDLVAQRRAERRIADKVAQFAAVAQAGGAA